MSAYLRRRSLWIVIVNYRTAILAIDCLRSIAPQVAALGGGRVVVADNDSRDGSAQKIAEAITREGWNEWALALALPRNGGFSYGNNYGIRIALRSGAEYVMLLNPDTAVRQGALQSLAEFMALHPTVGIVGARLENPDGEPDCSAHTAHSPLGELEGSARLALLSRVMNRYRVSAPPRDEAHECDWVSGAAMVVRHEVFAQVGLMDEHFFLYFEEADLCWRAKKFGWAVGYLPAARVMHLEGASTGICVKGRRRAAYWYDSRRRFFIKHYGIGSLLLADALWFCGRSSYLLRRALRLGAQRDVADPARFMLDLLWGDLSAALAGGTSRMGSAAYAGSRAPDDDPVAGVGDRENAVAAPHISASECGIVVIGRNEGVRLRECLRSMPKGMRVVYVDSGSSDGSAAYARAGGVEVIELDSSQPFSAARARNAGAARIGELDLRMKFIQFIDGDCILKPGWIPAAHAALQADEARAAVVGELTERYPDASSYNRLCALEWRSPAGDFKNFGALGGIAMLRAAVLFRLGGYNPGVIAGEDSELGVRIALAGFKVTKLAVPMATHDAAIKRFSQWWTRAVRAGHAIGQRSHLNGATALRDCVRERASTWAWGIALPGIMLVTLVPTRGLSLAMLAAYLLLFWRVLRFRRAQGDSFGDAVFYARYLLLAKLANGIGLVKFYLNRRVRRYELIEYK